MTTYTVSTVHNEEIRGVITAKIATFDDKAEAMDCAKLLAGDSVGDCFVYGPTSIAYSGLGVTTVVSW